MNGKWKQWIIGLALIGCVFATATAAEPIVLKSPDGKLLFTVIPGKDGQLTYSVSAQKESLISASSLGMDFGAAGQLPSDGWKIQQVERRKVKRTWEPVWAKRSVVPDRYNEVEIVLTGTNAPFDKFKIIARAYNDGVAFRYEIPIDAKGAPVKATGELTGFSFSGDYTAWFYNGEQHNLGPDKLSGVNGNRRPVMTVKAGEQAYMALHEADLRSGNPLLLTSKTGETAFTVASSPGMIQSGYLSPWRVVFYGKTPGVMVDSHLLELLNPPPPDDIDFSWVKPGVAMWDRRITGVTGGDFIYKWSSYPSWVRLVDFAAENGIPYLVIDSDWYGDQWDKASDPLKNKRPEADVKRLIEYAKTKDIGVWLYINDIAVKNYPVAHTFSEYSKWGVVGVKYGFMRATEEEKNRFTRMITDLCARHRLLCVYHDGPIHPYGQMRTYPNAVSREYCAAQLDSRRFYYPKTFTTTVFVNMLAGPLDMTNGAFDLLRDTTTEISEIYKHLDVPSTVVSEAARTLITFSGITMLLDIPENYDRYPELKSFIASQKMPWAESKTLKGEIGEYIVMARQAADGVWLVGAATNESARALDIPLDFLGKGKYEAMIIRDGDTADYLTNRREYKVEERTVRASDSVPVQLAAGGGACLIIKRK